MGGAVDAMKYQFPFIVQVVWRSCSGDRVIGDRDCPAVRCGGSFVNDDTILTAAQCVSNRYNGGSNADIEEVKVVAGTIYRIEDFEVFRNLSARSLLNSKKKQPKDYGIIFSVKEIIVHPKWQKKFDPATVGNHKYLKKLQYM